MTTHVLLDARDLGLRRGGRALLSAASLTVRSGERWVLVGANGSGKSTLLEVLAGRATPEDGVLRRAPGVALASVGQGWVRPEGGATLRDVAEAALTPLRALEADLEAARERLARAAPDAVDAIGTHYAELLSLFEERGGFGVDAELERSLEALGLRPDTPAADASAAAVRTAAVAGALASGAELVLLDEPTNGLDLPTRTELADRIRSSRSAFVVATHDRAFADRIGTHVAHLGGGRLTTARGTLAAFLRARTESTAADARAARERRKRAEELERMAAELARFGHRTAQTRRRRALRERDRLAAGPPSPAAPAEGVAGAAEVGAGTISPGLGGGAGAGARASGGARTLLRARHLSVPGVLDDESVDIAAGARVALVGRSGSGRSTLLELLAGIREGADPRAEVSTVRGTSLMLLDRVTRGLEDDLSPRAALGAWVHDARAEGLARLAGLPHDAWDRPAATLSGGERARAGLALLVAREPDLVLLDDPTDDLDLDGILMLEATLRDGAAAVVVATHDERLVEALGAEVWSIEDGTVVRYRGGMDGYRRGARRLEPGVPGVPGGPDGPAGRTGKGETVAEGLGVPAADAGGGVAGAIGGGGPGPLHGVEPDGLGAIEAELAAIAAALDDTGPTERERHRLRVRRRALEERLIARHDAAAAPPEPRFRTREAGVRVWADRDDGGLRVWLEDGPTLGVRLLGSVAHLAPAPDAGRCDLPWARRALVRAAARLAVYLLPVEVVQVSSELDLADDGFLRLGGDWWTLSRDELERRERWRRHAPDERHGRRRRRSVPAR